MIAGEIGDKTVALMQTTYGERPKNWLGGEAIRWTPKKSADAWQAWKPQKRTKIDFILTTAKAIGVKTPAFKRAPVWRNGRRTGLKIMRDEAPIQPFGTIPPFSLDFRKPLVGISEGNQPELDYGLTTV